MKALLRTLLLWFLLAGVPQQGFASATMLLCGPQPSQAVAAPPSHAMQPHAMRAEGHHDHAAMLAARHAVTTPDHAAGHFAAHPAAHADGDGSHVDHVKCASAGACCTGAPLAPALPAAPHRQDGRCATVPFIPAAPAAVDLAGLERPPRLASA